jgi:hypothetical protein
LERTTGSGPLEFFARLDLAQFQWPTIFPCGRCPATDKRK